VSWGDEFGAAPAPALTQFVLKVHSRCNLACNHCYVYEHADQSWRDRPLMIAADTVRIAADRIAEHASRHKLPRVSVVLHGGEPLLLGEKALRSVLARLRSTIDPVATLELRMQSNGVLLTEAVCQLLVEFGVRVGVSVDGDQVANDRHRLFPNGATSYPQALAGIALLSRPEYRRAFAGILCTVDLANDPIRVYDALRTMAPPQLDLLLPHATWDQPPDRPDGQRAGYGRWLRRIYERWCDEGRPLPIRLFQSLESTGGGGPSWSEWVGLDPADLVVIETDGAWEQVDSLKTAYHGAPVTGLDVFVNSVDEVAAHPGIARRQLGLADLCAECRACPVVTQCGGGLFTHRYRTGSGFDNRSVYCDDLVELIAAVNSTPPTAAASSASDWAVVPDDVLDQVASGYGDLRSIRHLVEAELGNVRRLVLSVVERARTAGTGRLVDPAIALLHELDSTGAVAVRDVLSHPYVRAWAVDEVSRAPGQTAEFGYLACVAGAAALRAGVGAELLVPVRGGALFLPTLGGLTLAGALTGLAELTIAPHGFTVRMGGEVLVVRPGDPRPQAGWRPSHRAAVDDLSITIEDNDPYRHCQDWPAAGPLPAIAARQWQSAVAAAWRLIHLDAPAQLAGLRAGLRAIAPLVPDPGGTLRSSTARRAFGALAIAPANAEQLAVMIVHEFQHTKLGALLDLVDLFDEQYPHRLGVGWRPDPRPVDGVLQGTYAHLAVADMWRSRALRAGPDQALARTNFGRYKGWTLAAVDALAGTGALLPAGTRFVTGMADTIAGWAG
jgi:uncharacterized protein